MFEEVCLVCGKDILHPSSVYCSNACADADWSSSSTCSSPVSTPAEVPQLYTHRTSISSTSSASSWSLPSDDLEQQQQRQQQQHDQCRIIDDDSLQLSYARKPSGTTNQAIVPLLLSRSSSDTYETVSPKRPPYASSLPVYFASLSISSKKPISTSSSSFTLTSDSPISPPTPKVPFKLSAVQPAQPQLTPPAPRERGRGRRRLSTEPSFDEEDEDEGSRTRSNRRRRRSSSRSHSRPLLDWQLPTTQHRHHAAAAAACSPPRRGRATADELDGWGSSLFAPGYGSGRSGLVRRDKSKRHGIRI